MRTFDEMKRAGPPFANDEVEALMKQIGKLGEEDYDDNDDTMVGKYADHIRNYLYNYKPEAQLYNPEDTPDKEHIGPMAQDLEKVNPDTVNEYPDGTKSVDTGRLALMNAGVIADLCRRVGTIEAFLEEVFGGSND